MLGAVWLGLSVYLGSYYVLWPAVALVLAGVLLRLRPGARLSWAWSKSATVLGMLLAAYIAYAAWPFTGGVFSTTAVITLAAFAVLAVVHFAMLYTGSPAAKQARSD